MLAAAGLPGVTSVAWMRGSRLVVGMREGNLLAVVDTAPREARDQVRAVYMQEEGFTDEFDVEPPGEAVEDEILRKINLIKVESVSEMGPGLLPPASLGALAYDPVGEAVLFTTVREAGTAIYRGGMDGSGENRGHGIPLPLAGMDGALKAFRGRMQAPKWCWNKFFSAMAPRLGTCLTWCTALSTARMTTWCGANRVQSSSRYVSLRTRPSNNGNRWANSILMAFGSSASRLILLASFLTSEASTC